MIEMNEQQAEALSRSNLYGLIARVFRRELDAALLAELRCPAVVAALEEAGAHLAEVLAPAVSAGGDDRILEELALEYTRLLLPPYGLSPHESVQRGEGQLWGEHTVAVRDFMAELGLAPAGERGLLPDHLATELEVMQHLAEAEADLLAAGGPETAGIARARQQQFLRDHLLRWVPDYCRNLAAAADHAFYREMADLGARFLVSEAAWATGQ